MNVEWTPPPAPMPARAQSSRRRRGMLAAVGLLGAGVVAGAAIGTTALSNAASPSTSPSSSAGSSGSSGSGSSSNEANEPHGGGHGLDLSGTVTAVGSSSVTIRTSSGTVHYAVSSSSDIDKNGESSLSKLAVGDAVTFSVDTVNNVKTIDKLHTGNESLNRPQDAPSGSAGG